MAQKFSEIFSFLTILNESIQILLKIWKFVVPVTTVSLSLTSLVVLIFTHLYQALMERFATPQNPESISCFLFILILSLVTLLAVEFCCLFVVITAANVSGTSTIMASAACYTDKKQSTPWELLSEAANKARRNPLNRGASRGVGSKTAIFFVVVVGLLTGVVVVLHMINPVTVCVLFLLWIASTAFALRSTAGRALVGVASVLEENCAEERSERLTEGRRLEAYMLDLSTNLFVMAVPLVLWLVIGDRGSQNLTIYGLIWCNLNLVIRVWISIVYTVFYFECKKHHGEHVLGVLLVGDSVV